MDLGIEGKRAAVAAGSSGLGLGVAEALASEGVRVAICGRDPDRLERAVESLGVDAAVVPVVADVSDVEGASAFVTAAVKALGGIDILVPNAGGPPAGNFASTDLDAYPAALQLNLMSTVAMCKLAVPAMQERGWGRVVAITSSTVRQPAAGLILSNVARTGATAFLKTLATEVAGDGVTVNSVCHRRRRGRAHRHRGRRARLRPGGGVPLLAARPLRHRGRRARRRWRLLRPAVARTRNAQRMTP
jgi:3-oxoacyl-[acyl-carrier protein] reductase